MNAKLQTIVQNIQKGGKNIVFTGAGISTESGISDYRSKGGIWDQYQPVYYDEFIRSKSARVEYWKRKFEMYPELIQAKPNRAHIALAKLIEHGWIDTIITQNIDGLHQAAGVPESKVIELHGNTMRVGCMSCHQISSIHEAQKRIETGDLAPECDCGGFLKPDTISFGQQMPEDEMKQSVELARNSDFFMVIGSTLLVQPASLLPGYAKENGAFLVIINLSDTPYDQQCDVLIDEYAGPTLHALSVELFSGN